MCKTGNREYMQRNNRYSDIKTIPHGSVLGSLFIIFYSLQTVFLLHGNFPRKLSSLEYCARFWFRETLDNGLKWNVYIAELCRMLSSTIFLLKPLTLWFSYNIWGNMMNSTKVSLLQEKALRVLSDAEFWELCTSWTNHFILSSDRRGCGGATWVMQKTKFYKYWEILRRMLLRTCCGYI